MTGSAGKLIGGVVVGWFLTRVSLMALKITCW